MDKHLHIVCHTIPDPPAHGGLTDLYYKIIALNKEGVKIHLHCFTRGDEKAKTLEPLCVSINYYRRKKYNLSFRLPYIVSSRANNQLIKSLNRDTYPILLEGIHCTYPLWKQALKERTIIIRLHNIEHLYYSRLAKLEKNLLKRLYFSLEAASLARYTRLLFSTNGHWLTVSERDAAWLNQQPGMCGKVDFVPVFNPYFHAKIQMGRGAYCLYHGNLSINENEAAALWLIHHVFNQLNIPFIIAGSNPSSKLLSEIKKYPHIKIIPNPSDDEITHLISDAHIHVLPSFNETGVKLKVLHALFAGRFVLTNTAAITDLALAALCINAGNADEYISRIQDLIHIDFTQELISHRAEVLQQHYNNSANARRIITYLSLPDPTPGHFPS